MTTTHDVEHRLHRPRTSGPMAGNGPTDTSAAVPGVLRLLRGRAALVSLLALLGATAALYLVGLSESGWANSFYAAAAQAGSESWSAFFFGASDAAGSITVDKTPLSLWPMALSIRIFGLSSWSLLVPQAIEGVAAVWLLHATVRRSTGSWVAATIAGATMALTPVAVLMFRFDNPDALLVLLLVGSAYAVQRAVEATEARVAGRSGHPVRWLALAGTLVGLGFLTKMLQAFLVVPALGLAYLLLAAVPLRHRIGHLLVSLGALVVAGGWWVAIVELWPGTRPYIGGSQHDSVLELALGYNGLGRLSGDETGSVGGGNGWGETGLLRLFDSDNGGQIAWLLPAAFVLGLAALWFALRSPRDDQRRGLLTGLTVWLGWLVVTYLTFSLMAGIFHPYYSVALSPAVGALVGTGAWLLWQHRERLTAAAVLGFTVALTGGLAFALLGRVGDWHPWLRWIVLVGCLVAGAGLAAISLLPARAGRAVAVLALVAALLAPASYSLSTAASAHTGSIPSAGPSTSTFGGGMPGGMPAGGPGTSAAGGLLTGSDPGDDLVALLLTDAEDYTWVAAAVGSNSASGYQLATEESVMPIGGFNGSDPSPTLEEFQADVAAGEIHYFIAGGQTGPGGTGGIGGTRAGGSDAASQIEAWVESTYTAQTVDGVTVYDLSGD